MTITVHHASHILQDFGDEMRAQVTKWGYQSHPDGTYLDESDRLAADAMKALVDEKAQEGWVTWRDILDEEIAEAYAENNPARLRAELVQAGAVIGSWIRDIDSREGGI